MDGTFDFANYHWGRILNSNNATQTLFRHAKDKSVVNFYIVNALGQNLANSESCPIYSEIVVRGQNL